MFQHRRPMWRTPGDDVDSAGDACGGRRGGFLASGDRCGGCRKPMWKGAEGDLKCHPLTLGCALREVATGMSLLLTICRFARVFQNRIVFRPAAEGFAQRVLRGWGGFRDDHEHPLRSRFLGIAGEHGDRDDTGDFLPTPGDTDLPARAAGVPDGHADGVGDHSADATSQDQENQQPFHFWTLNSKRRGARGQSQDRSFANMEFRNGIAR